MHSSASESFGERLAHFRRLSGMSAQQLSDAIGGELSRGVIANIETGRKKDVTLDQTIALAFALKIPFVALAVPIFEPYKWVRLIRGKDVKADMRAAELANWITRKPDAFRKDRGDTGAAGVVARAMLRAINEQIVLTAEVAQLQTKLTEEPGRYEEALAERQQELADIESTLLELGVSLEEEPY